jgi:hypothetical protein
MLDNGNDFAFEATGAIGELSYSELGAVTGGATVTTTAPTVTTNGSTTTATCPAGYDLLFQTDGRNASMTCVRISN